MTEPKSIRTTDAVIKKLKEISLHEGKSMHDVLLNLINCYKNTKHVKKLIGYPYGKEKVIVLSDDDIHIAEQFVEAQKNHDNYNKRLFTMTKGQIEKERKSLDEYLDNEVYKYYNLIKPIIGDNKENFRTFWHIA